MKWIIILALLSGCSHGGDSGSNSSTSFLRPGGDVVKGK